MYISIITLMKKKIKRVCWITSFPQNLAIIHLMILRNRFLWTKMTTDARAMTLHVGLLAQLTRGKNVTKK